MDTPSPTPIDSRLSDRILEIIDAAEGRTMRTDAVLAALSDTKAQTVRRALSRLGSSGKLHSPAHGVWAIQSVPRRSRPPVPSVEVVVPGATTDDLVMWGDGVAENNPISLGLEPFRPATRLELTERLFMGVELTFMAGDKPFFMLTLFSDIPTEEERQIMLSESAREGRL